MKRLALTLLCAAASMNAGVLFSDDFETGNFSHWALTYHGAVVADPLNGANKALHFTANESGGDLWSNFIPYTVGSTLYLSFDYLQTSVGEQGAPPIAFIGTDHQIGSFGVEEWLMSSHPNHAYASYSGMEGLSYDQWHHVTLAFQPYDPQSVGSLVLKLEQNDGTIGHAYFDNIVLADTPADAPEPGTWMLISGGIGLVAAARKLRR